MNQESDVSDIRISDPDPHRFPCTQCGSSLEFAPGMNTLCCPYCGHENQIAHSEVSIEEQDFRKTLREQAGSTPTRDNVTVHCESCGASYSFDSAVHAGECAFCGSPTVADTEQHRELQVQALLPFKVPVEQARDAFRNWLAKLWFAPSKLKRYARDEGRLAGMYVPYWTYDSETSTHYQGERGDNYQVEESYRAIEDGKEVIRTRIVTKIRWTSAVGRVSRFFDDVLVLASKSLPRSVTERLEPWDLENLQPYQEAYLSGFRSEMYQVELEQGFERACEIMAVTIRRDIQHDIGGDHQRIHASDTHYGAIHFKHILLPIWVSAFRFKEKVYRFVVNGRTGEVQGERPYSPWKIALAVLLALSLVGGSLALWQRYAANQGGAPTTQFQMR